MATLKNSIGLAQVRENTTLSYDVQGEEFSLYTSNHSYLMNSNVVEGNLVVTDCLLISFAMSRNDTEKNFLSFDKPEIFLAIQGKDYVGSTIVKNIYTAQGTGDNFWFDWDKHFGIGRIRIDISKLVSFNQITHIGLIVTRSNSNYGSDAVGKVYKINNTENVSNKLYSATTNGSNRLKSFDGFQKTITLNKNYQITEYDSDPYKTFTSFGNSGTSKLVISPITGTLEFSNVVGVGDDNVYTNPNYFYEKMKFSFKNYSLANSEIVPTYMRLSPSDTFLTLTNGQRVYEKINTNKQNKTYSTSTSGVQVVYGGYIYRLDDKELKHSSAFFDEVFSEEVFNENFSFYGNRYRTKFLSYGTNGGQECIYLKTQDVSGTLSTKNEYNIPFSGSCVFKKDGEDKIINISSKTNLSRNIDIANCKFKNKFTNEDETVTIHLPLIDEYQYYGFGLEFYLRPSAGEEIPLNTAEKEMVIPYGFEFLQNFDALRILDVSGLSFTENFDITTNIGNWIINKQKQPTNHPEKKDINKNKWNDPNSEIPSHFCYCFPVVKNGNGEDVTSKIKINIPEYITLFYCRQYPNGDITNLTYDYLDKNREKKTAKVITDVKIQDGKFYYKINGPGFTDYNDEFSVNQFINYACSDDGHNIGISQGDRIETLEIYAVGESIGYLQASEFTYLDLIKHFYTNSIFYLELPTEGWKKLQASGLSKVDVNLVYKSTQYGYTIFNIILKNVDVISGIRPVGLRKNGIIINPRQVTEDFRGMETSKDDLHNTFYRGQIINTSVRTSKGPDQNYKTTVAVPLQIKVYDESTNEQIQGYNPNCITYEMEYNDENKQFNGNWAFDGINVKEFEKQTLGDQDGSLAKQIKGNKDSITTINNTLSTILGISVFETETKFFKKTEKDDYRDGDAYDATAIITDSRITSNSICIPIIQPKSTNDTEIRNIGLTCYVTSVTAKNGQCDVGYATGCQGYTIRREWQVGIKLFVINIPTFTTTTTETEEI